MTETRVRYITEEMRDTADNIVKTERDTTLPLRLKGWADDIDARLEAAERLAVLAKLTERYLDRLRPAIYDEGGWYLREEILNLINATK